MKFNEEPAQIPHTFVIRSNPPSIQGCKKSVPSYPNKKTLFFPPLKEKIIPNAYINITQDII